MASDRPILERQMERVELRPFTLKGFHRRRQRKQRNRRMGTAVVALAVAAAGIGGLTRAFMSGAGTRPADQPPSPFVGAWASTDLGVGGPSTLLGGQPGSSQTMTIRAAEDGVLDIAVHDDSSWVCSDTPTTMTGTGRLEDPTTLVVPSPVLACVDGRDPAVGGPPLEEGPSSYTLVLDPATDRLFDNLGVAWHRGATPENGADTTTESGADRPGTYAMLGGEVTFHAARPWNDHVESYLDPRLFFLIGPDDAWIEILANPLPPEAPCASERAPRVPASAEALVRAIRSNPDLEATVPVAERVGGIDALRLDVAAVPGASTCPGGRVPVVSVSDRTAWGGMEHGDLGRLYVLDLPGGSARALAIIITAPEAAFERAVEAAAPVVESFQFHTG